MKPGLKLRNSIFILLLSIAALAISHFLYIRWFIRLKTGLKEIAKNFDLDFVLIVAPETFIVILTLSILVALILMGIGIIYFYYHKVLSLYRMQAGFIDSFTHELKTPVSSIRLYLDTFLKYELSRSESLKYLNYMKKDSERLLSQIERILNLARIKAGIRVLDPEETGLKDFLFSVYKAHPCHNLLKFDISESEKDISYLIDRELFSMLSGNLMENALLYNESSKPAIEVFIKKTAKNLVISFKDNGVGLKKKELKKIFKRFYRVSSEKKIQGTGLGLHLSDLIARMHKGFIWAESRGRGLEGSVFNLSLPLRSEKNNVKKNSFNRR